MLIEYGNRRYEILFGSDVINDGVYLELNDITEEPSENLLFAFWSDVDGSFTFSAYRENLPFELVETFLKEARKRLPPGTTSV